MGNASPCEPRVIDRIVLITTTDAVSGRSGELARLISSVDEFRSKNIETFIDMHILVQRASLGSPVEIPDWVNVNVVDERLSLSTARNIQLKKISVLPSDHTTLVAFPDDDAWFPSDFLQNLMKIFSDRDNLEFFFCRYSSTPSKWENPRIFKPSLAQVPQMASSNTIFFRGNLISKLGFFDEALGVGAKLNGGEDTDYAMRAFISASSSLACSERLIGHRDPKPELRPKYYAGTLRAITQNSRTQRNGVNIIARKIAVGALYVLRRQITPYQFYAALKSAFFLRGKTCDMKN